MMSTDPIVLLSAKRTPIASFLGGFARLSASQLGAQAIQGALSALGYSKECVLEHIQTCVMGCVISAGQGQAPARQALRGPQLNDRISAVTVNKMCGSGLQSVLDLAHALCAGALDMGIAGGMESMTNAPGILPSFRTGQKFGHQLMFDHMLKDGLEDAYTSKPMGWFADEVAAKYAISRAAQDAFARRSFECARNVNTSNTNQDEITAVVIPPQRKTDSHAEVIHDEPPFKVDLDKLDHLKPVFSENGSVTAGNASSIADGAAALILTRLSVAQTLGIQPLGKIVGGASIGVHPSEFPGAPVHSITHLLKKIGWSVSDVDLFEINEAFAMIPLLAHQEMQIPIDKINIRGGSCALGHPIGASGARVLVTLIHSLRARGGGRGIASLCVGGGEAISIAIEV